MFVKQPAGAPAMNIRAFRPLRRVLPAAAALALLALSGCVAYPAYPGYGYPGGYAYAPAPAAVYVPPVEVGVGCCWGGGRWGWGGGHWR
jgi:hypothetical protein